MRWARDGLQRVQALGLSELVTKLQRALDGRQLTMSSSCTGILTAELGTQIALKPLGIEVQPLHAIEKNAACCQELLHHPTPPPAHLR